MTRDLDIGYALAEELSRKLSVIRLSKTGLFRKLIRFYDNVPKDVEPYLLLNFLVLDKALMDMFSPKKDIRDDVVSWLSLDNPDFIETCERSLLNPEMVYNTFMLVEKLIKGKKRKFKDFNGK